MSAGPVCALLVAAAAWVELRRGPSLSSRLQRLGAARLRWSRGPAVGAEAPWRQPDPAARGAAQLTDWVRRRAGRREQERDLAEVVTEVASRLRAGAPVDEAWRRSLERSGRRAVGTPEGLPRARLAAAARTGRDADRGHPAQVAAVEAACRLAESLGAPLADVLDRCGEGLAEAARADAARQVALAGPASTARLLAWLPAAGVVVGWALGADPLGALLDGGVGTAAGLVGGGLLVLGRRWTAALVAAANGDSVRGRRGGARPVGARVSNRRPA